MATVRTVGFEADLFATWEHSYVNVLGLGAAVRQALGLGLGGIGRRSAGLSLLCEPPHRPSGGNRSQSSQYLRLYGVSGCLTQGKLGT